MNWPTGPGPVHRQADAGCGPRWHGSRFNYAGEVQIQKERHLKEVPDSNFEPIDDLPGPAMEKFSMILSTPPLSSLLVPRGLIQILFDPEKSIPYHCLTLTLAVPIETKLEVTNLRLSGTFGVPLNVFLSAFQ